MNIAFVLFSLVASLSISFLMSGMEAGVFAMSRLRIRQQVRSGNPRAAALLRYLEHPEHFLWTILVGNTVANLAAVSLVVLSLHEWAWLAAHPVLFWTTIAIVALLFYSLCDLLPKMLFRTYPNRLCMRLAVPFHIIDWFMSPLVWAVGLFSRILLRWTGGARFTGHLFGNRDELRMLMQETGQALSSEERTMINRVLDLQNRSLSEIVVPFDRVSMLPVNATIGQLLALRRERGFSRYPIFRESGGKRTVVGFVNCKRVLYEVDLNPARPLAEFLKPSLFLDGVLRLDVALRQMQRSGQRLAIVLGPEQQELGIVSLTDILQTIFGEVRL